MNMHKFIYECVICTNLWEFLYIKLEGFALCLDYLIKKQDDPKPTVLVALQGLGERLS